LTGCSGRASRFQVIAPDVFAVAMPLQFSAKLLDSVNSEKGQA